MQVQEALGYLEALKSLPEAKLETFRAWEQPNSIDHAHPALRRIPARHNFLADAFALIEDLPPVEPNLKGVRVGLVLANPQDLSPEKDQDPTGVFYQGPDSTGWMAWGAQVFFTDAIPTGISYVFGMLGDKPNVFQPIEWVKPENQ